MSSACLSTEKMRAFLDGHLPGDEERSFSDHIEQCAECEKQISAFSDDQHVRQIATSSSRHRSFEDPSGAVTDLSRRLQALARYEVAHSRAPSQHGGAADPPARANDALALTNLGRYKIVRLLGKGSFGAVYLAEDQRLLRQVALKVARCSVLLDAELKLRFFREAETLARLAHPHIVQVYEADEIDDLCFLAIAFCEGPTLEDWLRQRPSPLDPRSAAQLLVSLADAVEHAHAHGVLHRDIKPANILLAVPPATADLPFVQLTDFGLAKILDDDFHASQSGLVLGTPQYMAPEQAAGDLERLGSATDVYGLGAVLYHILTGRPPIEGKTMLDTLRRILIEPPPEVHAAVPAVPEDLSAIVMKCLEKSPADRYRTAADLADDLRRFLNGRPTIARPLSTGQRAAKWARRNPMLTALIGMTAAVAFLSLGLLDHSFRLSATKHAVAREAHKSLTLAQQVQTSAVSIAQRDYVNDIRLASEEAFRGNTAQAMKTLARQTPQSGGLDLRGFEWHYLWSLVHRRPLAETDAGEDVYQICLSPDERELIAAGKDGLIRFYNAPKLTLKAAVPTGQGEVNCAAYSPDGKRVATAGDNGTLRIWDAHARSVLLTIAAHADHAYGVLFFAGGSKLASCGKDSSIRLWDVATGQPLGVLDGHIKAVEALALSPDGKLLASAGSDAVATIWNLQTREKLHTLSGFEHRLTSVTFSPDGNWLAIGSLDRTASLWEVRTGRKLTEQQHLDGIQAIAFSRDGKRLKVADCSGTLRNYYIVPPKNGEPARLVLRSLGDAWGAHPTRTWSVAAGATDRALYSAAKDGMVRRWKPDRDHQVQRVISARRGDRFVDLEFTADGSSLVVLRETSGPSLLNAMALEPRHSFPSRDAHWRSLAILAGQSEVAAGNLHGAVAIWDLQTGEQKRLLDTPREDFAVVDLAYSPPTGLLAVLRDGAEDIRLYDAATGEFVDRLPFSNLSAMAMSPDGNRLAVGFNHEVQIYDMATRKLRYVLSGHTGDIDAIAFSPDGQSLASGASDRSLRIWSRDGLPVVALAEHYASPGHLQFMPSGKTLVTGDDAGMLRLIHVATGLAMFDVPTNTNHIRGLAVAPRKVAVILASNDILLNDAFRTEP